MSLQNYTTVEAAKILRCSDEEARRMVKAGDLPGSYTIGRGTRRKRYVIPASAIEAYQQANVVMPDRPDPKRKVVRTKKRRWV